MYDILMGQSFHEYIMVINPEYQVLDMNLALRQKLGVQDALPIGKYCYNLIHHIKKPCSGNLHPCPLMEAIKLGEPVRSTHTHLDQDNNEFLHSITCFPVFENGNAVAVVEIIQDASRKAMIEIQNLIQSVPGDNAELKQSKKKLRKAVVKRVEKNFVLKALVQSDWNVTVAAKMVGIQRTNFQNMMKTHNIKLMAK